jgi:aspartate/methionine/tyrosine aminotransferase
VSADAVNRALAEEAPALHAALSPLGRRAVYPKGIPFQAAEARGRAYNATIGQITDGRGGAVPLPSMAAALAGLAASERNRALLYSPIEGFADLRKAWRAWQRRDAPSGADSSLPLVTAGLTHGLSLAADLFAGEGRAVAVPDPFWGNYRQTFVTRTGARLLPAPSYRDGRFDPGSLAAALATLPDGEPALAIVNFPSNPGGYSPTPDERRVLVDSLLAAADRRPLVVLCDDAYAGLVYEPDIPRTSLFWNLAGRHPNLAPIKIDGATKEFSFFGGRVGFLTFALPPGSSAAAALESKVKCLLRATVGSPVSASQAVLLAGLTSPDRDREVESIRALLSERYQALKSALATADPALLTPLPFNSGCFALLQLPPTLDPETLRRHLLDHQDTGVISITPNYLRLAHCSVAAAAIPELVSRIEQGARDLASA